MDFYAWKERSSLAETGNDVDAEACLGRVLRWKAAGSPGPTAEMMRIPLGEGRAFVRASVTVLHRETYFFPPPHQMSPTTTHRAAVGRRDE